MRLAFLICLLVTQQAFAQDNVSTWFQFQPRNYFSKSEVDLSSWLDKPAGKHGVLQIKGKDYEFEDGTPVKFWGVNICSDEPFSEKRKVDEWVHIMSKYGINGVRFHKFTWDATDGIHSTQLTKDKWVRFDYFNNALREAGIYYSWSHIYGHRVLPADSSRLLAYDEIKNTRFPWSHLNGTTASLVNFAEDLQSLNIELTINMLNHVNPLTGKKYADDPALTVIELQNEDNIFWAAMEETLKQTPTYRALLCKKFTHWLREKYKTQSALEKAWKGLGLDKGQTLAAENIYPNPNHGLFSYEYEQALREKRNVPVHIADRAAFLFSEQMKFYEKFSKAIRKTGYRGVIVGSCWQAGSGITHFYNLYSDYKTGAIDRHNYFGGGSGHQLKPGKFDNTSMLTKPGSGLLSTGLQMVSDRPFQLSEWMNLIPNEWIPEASPIVAVYGLGLQGWDASYSFAMDFTTFTNTIQSGHGVYNVTSPGHLALYPALAAMIYRKDIREGRPAADRALTIEQLRKGVIPFNEKTAQQYDVKSFESTVPTEALAVGPVTVSFNTKRKKTTDLPHDITDSVKTVVSNTGQLNWNYTKKGYFTVNTDGTKALVGFAPGEKQELGKYSITTSNEFAVIIISSFEKAKSLDETNKILITTMARARNTGMKFNESHTELLEVGTAPIILEPVSAAIEFPGNKTWTVHILDHTGNKTGKILHFNGRTLHLEGKDTKAFYYLAESAQ